MLWKSNIESKVVATGRLRCFDKDNSRKIAKYTTELADLSTALAESFLVYGSSNALSHQVLASCATEFTA